MKTDTDVKRQAFVGACQAAHTAFEEWIQCFDEEQLKNNFSHLAAIRRDLDSLRQSVG